MSVFRLTTAGSGKEGKHKLDIELRVTARQPGCEASEAPPGSKPATWQKEQRSRVLLQGFSTWSSTVPGLRGCECLSVAAIETVRWGGRVVNYPGNCLGRVRV